MGAMCALATQARAAGTLSDLGSLQPGCGSTAAAINNRGQVAGTSCHEPFRWTAAHGMRGLGFLSSVNPYGSAAAINANGDVVGTAEDSTGGGNPNVFEWTPAKGMRNLTPQDTYPGAYGEAINASGQVAYTELSVDGLDSALLRTPGQGIQKVGYLPEGNWIVVGLGNGDCSCAAALDNRGDVTGNGVRLIETDQGYEAEYDAYLWTPAGGTQDLGTLPGDTGSEGVAVNIHQDVAGDASNDAGFSEAFVWTPTGGMQGLLLPGAISSNALGLNDRGEVVGYAQLSGGTTEAFLYLPGHGVIGLGAGKAVAINQSGAVAVAGTNGDAYRWTASTGLQELAAGTPTAINDHGQIVGNGSNGDAFLWSPGTRP